MRSLPILKPARRGRIHGFPFVVAALAVSAPCLAADEPVYRDASAPVPERVEDLLGRMTTDEKIAQIRSVWDSKVDLVDDEGRFDPAQARRLWPHGFGSFSRPNDTQGPASPRVVPWRSIARTVELVNAIQSFAIEETRLGIPVLFHEEGLHGYAAVGATSFPQAIALASSWDPDLVREVNAVTAREIRARGVHLVLSPVVDIARDARWGRFEETFGEDPWLVSELGVAAVEGLQGRGTIEKLAPGKVFATLKHMTGHGQPESGTNVGPAPISERELRENFFPPFRAVVERTDIQAVMPSYNEIDGVPSHVNRWLIHDVLREEWGFDGMVVSDYYAIEQLVDLHHVVSDYTAAAAAALRAGVDVDLPDGRAFAHLPAALDAGLVTEADIDRAVRRLLEVKFRAGLFEEPFADPDHARAVTNTRKARALARRAAERSVVLLANDGVLPLDADALGRIAVIGPNADVARLGGYYGIPPITVSLLAGVRTYVGDRAEVVFAQGVKITENDDWWADEVVLADPEENRRLIREAVDVARGADVIVLAIGGNEQTSREGWADSHLGDRASLELVGEQQELFDALHALGIPIVVVLNNGRPLATVDIAEKANALIEAWYLGEQGGTALANVLFGDVNPGGKLPVTIPREVGQLPMFYNHKPSARRGYLFASTEPLYPFGWGLSYTTFEISAPELSAASIPADGTVEVRVTVTNTGERAGDETVQLYVRDRVSSVTRPVKELKGFERVSLEPGEQKTVSFRLGPEAFRLWNADMREVVEPGEFEIMAGPNSVDLKSSVLTIADGAVVAARESAE
ncbi:MAG TPA: glycoside hydrolase family 3 N-terminal domain-containing protein [Woeseiaceae bacterium]|nr:glycoside hydrolase family 3 N-terminal domain-containing protein [Woeseiaceae bacterium]